MNESYFEPLDDKELHDHLRLSLPATIARAGWNLDEEAILAAIDYLEIKLPVRVRFMTTKYGESLGSHYSRADWHRITIAQNLKQAGRASETLWHELVHCMQAERYVKENPGKTINDFHEYYKMMDGDWGNSYRGNLLEKEANRIATERNVAHLLCHDARSRQ